MASVLFFRDLGTRRLDELPSPVVVCVESLIIKQAILNAQYPEISLNLILAKALLDKPERVAGYGVSDVVLDIFPKKGCVHLVDYEMLFDPRYHIDVLRLFMEIARKCKLIVQWCGNLCDGLLTYSEPGLPDYKTYKINDYVVTYIM